jgi:putative acetyltransferase
MQDYRKLTLKLYRKRGFVDGEPLADYQRSDFNQFLHLAL